MRSKKSRVFIRKNNLPYMFAEINCKSCLMSRLINDHDKEKFIKQQMMVLRISDMLDIFANTGCTEIRKSFIYCISYNHVRSSCSESNYINSII